MTILHSSIPVATWAGMEAREGRDATRHLRGRRTENWKLGIAKVEEGGSHDEEAVEQLEIGWCQNWRETREIGRERNRRGKTQRDKGEGGRSFLNLPRHP